MYLLFYSYYFHFVVVVVDIDECKLGKELCVENEYCKNVIGSYQCKCKRGFERNAGKCKGIQNSFISVVIINMLYNTWIRVFLQLKTTVLRMKKGIYGCIQILFLGCLLYRVILRDMLFQFCFDCRCQWMWNWKIPVQLQQNMLESERDLRMHRGKTLKPF